MFPYFELDVTDRSRKHLSNHGFEMGERASWIIGVKRCLVPRLTKMNTPIVVGMVLILFASVTIGTHMMCIVIGLKYAMLLYDPNDLIAYEGF